jgi:hypothetical protein
MTKISFRKFGLGLGLLSTIGCSSAPTTLVPSTSPLPPGVRGTIKAYGSDCQYYFLGIIPISGSANTQAALEDAKSDADADVLTDVTIDHGGGYYILLSTHCVRVRGKGVPKEITDRLRVN